MKFKELKKILTKHEGKKITNDDIGLALGTTGQNIGKRDRTGSVLNLEEIGKIEKSFKIKLINYAKLPEIQNYEKKFNKFQQENYYNIIPTDLEDLTTYPNDQLTPKETNKIIRVPFYPDLKASCGDGTLRPFSIPVSEYYPISSDYGLCKNKKYFIVPAFGPSMEKTIYDKELIIFERWENKQIVDDKVYLFRHNGRWYIKRLILNINEIIVLSDNNTKDDSGEPIYKPQIIKIEDLYTLEIFGKFKGKIEND